MSYIEIIISDNVYTNLPEHCNENKPLDWNLNKRAQRALERSPEAEDF